MNAAAARPRTALLFACLVLPWLTPFTGGPSTWVQPWLVASACTVVFFLAADPQAVPRALLGTLAAFALWVLVRGAAAPEAWAAAGGCAVIGLAAASSRRDMGQLIAWGWLVAALASTCIAFAQYFGVADALSPWVSSSALGEAYGNLRQRNQFATLTAIGMASLFALVPARMPRGVAIGAGVLLAAANAATTSRTGLLELFTLGVLAAAWPGLRRDRAILWGAMLVAYLVAAVALPSLQELAGGTAVTRLWDRVASVDECSSRAVLWSNVLHLIALRPLVGWGWGELDFAHFHTLYPGARFCDILDNAHNFPLHMAVELGAPAALLLCGFIAWRAWRASPMREHDPVRQMAWAVLAIVALHSLLEYPLWYGPFQLACGLALGLLVAPAREVTSRAMPSWPRLAVGALLMVAIAYASWDYRRVSQVYLSPESRDARVRDNPLPEALKSFLFRGQARFAEVTVTPLSRANAAWTREAALASLHFSPEPRVIEKAIEADVMLGRDDEALLLLARYRAAFPKDHAAWAQEQRTGVRRPVSD